MFMKKGECRIEKAFFKIEKKHIGRSKRRKKEQARRSKKFWLRN
jgi:hypothetical protein